MKKIWIVQGSCGEYSAHAEWMICYYTDKELAKKHVENATRRHGEIKQVLTTYEEENERGEDFCGCGNNHIHSDCKTHGKLKNKWDKYGMYDGDTNYNCYEVEMGVLEK